MRNGCSQAVFALLYDYTGNPILSIQLYHELKVDLLTGAKEGGIITTRDMKSENN
jgi:hypothetical protein